MLREEGRSRHRGVPGGKGGPRRFGREGGVCEGQRPTFDRNPSSPHQPNALTLSTAGDAHAQPQATAPRGTGRCLPVKVKEAHRGALSPIKPGRGASAPGVIEKIIQYALRRTAEAGDLLKMGGGGCETHSTMTAAEQSRASLHAAKCRTGLHRTGATSAPHPFSSTNAYV